MIRRAHVRLPAASAALLLVVTGLIAGGPAAAQSNECHPILSQASFLGQVPTTDEVDLGGSPLPALGSREITVAESDAYLDAVDDASDRVVTDVAGHSVEGRPLTYAIVGRPDNVTEAGLASIRQAVETLRDPATSAQTATTLAATTPAILYVQANVHGGEESGTESSLQLLYELADRDDCVSDTILDNSIVVILPVQNPDGRVADTRRNAYDIDMNRDWFARTQPETDAKLELLRR